jgi:DNA-binding transcriptional ArsR family regulator
LNIVISSTLDSAFAALADPTRRTIVQQLAKKASRVTDIAEPFKMSLNAVSKHVKVLERAGFLKRVRMGREHVLVFQPAPLRDIANWTARYERFWNERLDRLELFLKTHDTKERP